MLRKIIILCLLFFPPFGMADTEAYTCGKIKRDEVLDNLDMSCLEYPEPIHKYKSEMMMHKLLEHIETVEQQIGRQSVFFVARAGELLQGFNRLKSFDEFDNPISLDEVFNYGNKFLPQSVPKRYRYHDLDFDNWVRENDLWNVQSFSQTMGEARRRIKNRYLYSQKPKLIYSHAAILFRTQNGWNILHELMPCNQKQKAYTFREPTTPMYSRFFLDKPSHYRALIIPLEVNLQTRILHMVDEKRMQDIMNRSPVYRAMASPWQVNDHNSNSFILELIESARLPINKYRSLYRNFEKKEKAYQAYLDSHLLEGQRDLTTSQKEKIEKYDEGFKKVCRYDIESRTQVVQSYIDNGYQPTKVVLDDNILKGNVLNRLKMQFIREEVVPDHIQPDLKLYKRHLAIGIGEAVTVASIKEYILRQKLNFPGSNPEMYEVPDLTHEDGLKFKSRILQDINHGRVLVKEKVTDEEGRIIVKKRFRSYKPEERAQERENFLTVLHDMNPVVIKKKKLEVNHAQ